VAEDWQGLAENGGFPADQAGLLPSAKIVDGMAITSQKIT
jgi:hypothetical protein